LLCFGVTHTNSSHPHSWRLIDVLSAATEYLAKNNIDSARLNAERLLAHVLGITRVDLYLRYAQPLTETERDALKDLLRRRASCEPLQYILGETEFMSLPFRVTPDVLIPRPETEILVERAIDWIRSSRKEGEDLTCLDIGTGSGAIAVSLAYLCPALQVWAVDKEASALDVTRQNAETNSVIERIRIIQLDAEQPDFSQKLERRFGIVVSNPPYVSRIELESLQTEIREHEPRAALDGGEDGLRFYRALAMFLPTILNPSGRCFLEIGATQAETVSRILLAHHTWTIEVIQDLAGMDRVLALSNQM